MIEVGKIGEICWADLLQPLDLKVDSRGEMPFLEAGRVVLCGYNQGLGERLFVCHTPDDVKQLDNAYGRGAALHIKWYSPPPALERILVDTDRQATDVEVLRQLRVEGSSGQVGIKGATEIFTSGPAAAAAFSASAASVTVEAVPVSSNGHAPVEAGWGARFLSTASSLLWWRRPVPVQTAAPVVFEPPVERKPDEMFFDDIPLDQRMQHFTRVLQKEGLRPMNDQLPEFIGQQASIPGLPFANPAYVEHFWRHEGGTKPNTEIMVFYAQDPPAELKDVSIVVFGQKINQPVIEAYTTSERGSMNLADLFASKSFESLRELILKHGGARADAAPSVARTSSPARVETYDVA